MIYITGDTHRNESDFQDILEFCKLYETTKDDVMIITGDVGVNYFMDYSDSEIKNWLETFPITFLMVRGNHEERPENIPSYELTHLERDNFKGDVFVEEGYPSLLSHTCPKKYMPYEAMLPGFDQSKISHLMENFLDEVEEALDYDTWYCGHWHIDKREGDMVFLYNEIMEVE